MSHAVQRGLALSLLARGVIIRWGMAEIDETATAQGLAGHAFQQLRSEVALLRRGVEALTAERQAQPDHGAALTGIVQRIETLAAGIRRIADQPAIQLTPAELAEQIEWAGKAVRDRDQAIIERAGSELSAAASRIDRITKSARMEHEQDRALHIRTGCAFLLGISLTQGLNDVDRQLRVDTAAETVERSSPVITAPAPTTPAPTTVRAARDPHHHKHRR